MRVGQALGPVVVYMQTDPPEQFMRAGAHTCIMALIMQFTIMCCISGMSGHVSHVSLVKGVQLEAQDELMTLSIGNTPGHCQTSATLLTDYVRKKPLRTSSTRHQTSTETHQVYSLYIRHHR